MEQVTVTEDELEALQWVSIDYYLKEVNHRNGLVRDKTQDGAPASIAAVGMALATAPLVVQSGALPRDFMARRTLTKLRFFWNLLSLPLRPPAAGSAPTAAGTSGLPA